MRNKSNDINIRTSKFLSLVLRHSPETIRLNMDKNGWVNINELIDNANKYKNMHLTVDLIKMIVETNDKRRFIISEDGERIRANQGHSVAIDLELESKLPLNILYHGTASCFFDSIIKDGLKSMTRQYVHLSETEETALTVGKRHGKPIVLYIDSKKSLKKVINSIYKGCDMTDSTQTAEMLLNNVLEIQKTVKNDEPPFACPVPCETARG